MTHTSRDRVSSLLETNPEASDSFAWDLGISDFGFWDFEFEVSEVVGGRPNWGKMMSKHGRTGGVTIGGRRPFPSPT